MPYVGEVLEPRQSVRAAIEQFRAVREAVGDEIGICFDVHTRLDLPEAVWFCREVEPFHPFFIEDPLRSENPDAFKTLRPRTAAPLAAGEQFGSKWEFRQLIEEEWIDYARIDVCIVGGLTEAAKIAGWCETHYIKLALHNPLGPVSTAACLQLDLASPLVGVQEQPRKPGVDMTRVVPVQVPWEDGYLLPPTFRGWASCSIARRRKHPMQPRAPPSQLASLDGSFHELVAGGGDTFAGDAVLANPSSLPGYPYRRVGVGVVQWASDLCRYRTPEVHCWRNTPWVPGQSQGFPWADT